MTPQQLDALSKFACAAIDAERRYGVPADLTVSQAVVESGWGTKMPGNNCFGIKASSRHPQSVVVTTHEVFSQQQLAAWNQKHPNRPARDIEPQSDGKVRCVIDDEFAAYPDLAGCFEDHSQMFLWPPYLPMLVKFEQSENLPGFIREVATKYATDPNYAKLLLSILSMKAVQDAIRQARQAAPKAA